jgi:hypothetical protein
MNDDDDPLIVEQMIQYFYNAKYVDTSSGKLSDSSSLPEPSKSAGTFEFWNDVRAEAAKPLFLRANMYIMADKHNVNALKALAARNFRCIAGICWRTLAFIEVAAHVWENTIASDTQLRDAITDIAFANLGYLMGNEQFNSMELMPERDTFAWSLLKARTRMYRDRDLGNNPM